MSTSGPRFVVIGENIHATRVLLKKNERIALNEAGEEGIVFTDSEGNASHLRISEKEKSSQAYAEGRIKHVRLAVALAMSRRRSAAFTAASDIGRSRLRWDGNT